MDRISKFIVRYRIKILLVAVLLLIPSVIGYFNTGINYDILSYLPKEAESMKGQEVLDKDFNLASVGMMVTNDLSDKEVVSLKDKIEKIDGVKQVFWRDDVLDITFPKEMIPETLQKQLYSKDSTLMIVTFEEDTASPKTMDAIAKIKEVSNKDCYLGGMSAIAEDTKDLANSETVKYALIAVLLSLYVGHGFSHHLQLWNQHLLRKDFLYYTGFGDDFAISCDNGLFDFPFTSLSGRKEKSREYDQ